MEYDLGDKAPTDIREREAQRLLIDGSQETLNDGYSCGSKC